MQIQVQDSRILGYDLGRSAALTGMVMISFWELGGENVSPAWLYAFIQIIMGRAAVMFVILAGVGLYLLSKAAYLSEDATKITENRRTLMKRALFLFLVGMANSLIWPWDILHFYSVYFMIGAYLLTASDRQFAAIILVVIAIFSLFMLLTQFERGEEWQSIRPTDLWYLPGLLYHLFFCGLYPVFPWIGFLFIGIWLGRHDLTDRRFRRTMIFASSVSVIIAEAASEIFFQIYTSEWRTVRLERLVPWLDIDPWEPMPLFFLSGAGSAIIAINLCVILGERFKNAKWFLPLVAVGQTTLTLYVAHTLVGTVVIAAMDLMEWSYPLFAVWGTVLYLVIALIFCSQWNKRFQRGPLELAMRFFLALPMRLTVSGTPPLDMTKRM